MTVDNLKHSTKRVISKIWILFLVLLFLYPLTAKAAEVVPSDKDRTGIKVYGVEKGSTVAAYHIVYASYNQYGLTGYYQDANSVAISKIADFNKPTYANIATLSRNIKWNTNGIKDKLERIELTYNAADKSYVTTEAKAGSYLVIVEHETEGYIYNSMYVSNEYTNANKASSLGKGTDNGSVDATGNGTFSGKVAYAKKDTVPFDKVIVDSSTGNERVDDEHVGDTVKFEISTQVPDYSNCYDATRELTKIKFCITDTQSKGLDPAKKENIHVFIKDANGEREVKEVEDGKAIYKLTTDDATNSFKVDFDSAWIRDNESIEIYIRYSTIINEDAVLADNSNPNKAELEYTTVHGETFKLKAITRHYTYAFNVLKTTTDKKALAGAEFLLTQKSENNVNGAKQCDKSYTVVSDDNGLVKFVGLDEGTYSLKETKAAPGYVLTDKTWTIKVSPEYDPSTNRITKYSVNVKEDGVEGDGVTNSYTVKTWEESDDQLSDTVTIVEDNEREIPLFTIINTELNKLPSTGGNGTLMICIIGVVLVAGGLYLTRKNKNE